MPKSSGCFCEFDENREDKRTPDKHSSRIINTGYLVKKFEAEDFCKLTHESEDVAN